MAYIDLAPTKSKVSGGFNYGNRALTNDSRYSECSSGWVGTPRLKLYDLDISSLPKNITINAIQVVVNAKINGTTSTATLGIKLSQNINNSGYLSSDTLTSSVLTSSINTYTLGSSSTLNWNYNFKYWQLLEDDFGIELIPQTDSNVDYLIDNAVVRVFYTQNTTLVGNRSKFSTNIDSPVDDIDYVVNGLGLDKQIKSEQLNTIGDALYNIEFALINKPINSIPILGNGLNAGSMYAVTMTITGTINTVSTSLISYYVSKSYSPAFDYYFNSIHNPLSTPVPKTNLTLNFYAMSGIGWVQPGTGSIIGLYVSPTVMNVNKNVVGGMDFTFGFTATRKEIVGSVSDTNLGGYLGTRIDSWTASPTGTIYIKLMGLAIGGV
jgi:hypothetical protein